MTVRIKCSVGAAPRRVVSWGLGDRGLHEMKASRFRLQMSDDTTLRPGLLRWCRNTLDRWFPPRELILRTDGRVSYLAISSRQQKVTAAVLLGFALWGGYATTSMIVSGRQLEAKRGELDRAQVAYVDLLNEVARSYDQFLGFARNLNTDQKNLLAQGNNPTTGGSL